MSWEKWPEWSDLLKSPIVWDTNPKNEVELATPPIRKKTMNLLNAGMDEKIELNEIEQKMYEIILEVFTSSINKAISRKKIWPNVDLPWLIENLWIFKKHPGLIQFSQELARIETYITNVENTLAKMIIEKWWTVRSWKEQNYERTKEKLTNLSDIIAIKYNMTKIVTELWKIILADAKNHELSIDWYVNNLFFIIDRIIEQFKEWLKNYKEKKDVK